MKELRIWKLIAIWLEKKFRKGS